MSARALSHPTRWHWVTRSYLGPPLQLGEHFFHAPRDHPSGIPCPLAEHAVRLPFNVCDGTGFGGEMKKKTPSQQRCLNMVCVKNRASEKTPSTVYLPSTLISRRTRWLTQPMLCCSIFVCFFGVCYTRKPVAVSHSPEPVWPYAKQHPLNPFMMFST